jgi:hypothetical protein
LRLTDERGEPRLPAAETILRAGLRRFGGRCLGDISPDWNARALLWPLGTEHLLEIADKVVGREFTEAERVRYGVSESAAV